MSAMSAFLPTRAPDLGFLEGLPDTLGDRAGLLPNIRQAGRARFIASGMPTKRHEAWRFTDLKPLLNKQFEVGTGDTAALDALIAGLAVTSPLVVFVDGWFDRKRSRIGELQGNVYLGSFAAWAEFHPVEAAASFDLMGGDDRAFLSLNAAFFTDGLALVVPTGMAVPPIRVVHWNSGGSSQLKFYVSLGVGAHATLVETYAGTGAGWTNLSATLLLGDEARLERYVLQNEAIDAFHTSHLAAEIGRKAALDSFVLNLGARLARHDAAPVLAGDHGFCGYSGAYFLSGRQDFGVASVIGHNAPNCGSREVFKGVLDDRAHGAFQGKIYVAPNAQKTDGYQLNKTMLLSDRAVMDSKPELEIYADDVKCSHGATIGDLDETALFYLRSRGIDSEAARQMLIQAFVADAIELIEDTGARDYFAAALAMRLTGQVAGE